MAKTTKERKQILAGILQSPDRRRVLAEQLATQVGTETKTGGLGLLRTLSKEFPTEVQEVLDIIENMPAPKKGGKKKASGKKKGGNKGLVKKKESGKKKSSSKKTNKTGKNNTSKKTFKKKITK